MPHESESVGGSPLASHVSAGCGFMRDRPARRHAPARAIPTKSASPQKLGGAPTMPAASLRSWSGSLMPAKPSATGTSFRTRAWGTGPHSRECVRWEIRGAAAKPAMTATSARQDARLSARRPPPRLCSAPIVEVSARRTAHRSCAWGIIDGLAQLSWQDDQFGGRSNTNTDSGVQNRHPRQKIFLRYAAGAVPEDLRRETRSGPLTQPVARFPEPQPSDPRVSRARCRDVVRLHVLRSGAWGPRRPTRN
jgi:hypothetical protein